MTMVNEFYKAKKINKAEFRTFLQLLNPFAPHITEELNEKLGFTQTLAETPWPTFDDEKTKENSVEIALQVKGKVRSRIVVPIDISKEDAIELAKKDEKIAAEIAGKEIKKEIYVPGKLVNIVAISSDEDIGSTSIMFLNTFLSNNADEFSLVTGILPSSYLWSIIAFNFSLIFLNSVLFLTRK